MENLTVNTVRSTIRTPNRRQVIGMADENNLNRQLANLLGGRSEVSYNKGPGRSGRIDVKVGAWVIECSFTRADAILNAETRVSHGFWRVLAVWYPANTRTLSPSSRINWRDVSHNPAQDRHGTVRTLADSTL